MFNQKGFLLAIKENQTFEFIHSADDTKLINIPPNNPYNKYIPYHFNDNLYIDKGITLSSFLGDNMFSVNIFLGGDGLVSVITVSDNIIVGISCNSKRLLCDDLFSVNDNGPNFGAAITSFFRKFMIVLLISMFII